MSIFNANKFLLTTDVIIKFEITTNIYSKKFINTSTTSISSLYKLMLSGRSLGLYLERIINLVFPIQSSSGLTLLLKLVIILDSSIRFKAYSFQSSSVNQLSKNFTNFTNWPVVNTPLTNLLRKQPRLATQYLITLTGRPDRPGELQLSLSRIDIKDFFSKTF